ncbi:MAG: methyltransferase domain-containing protein [Gammaproteobacteria bacterium]|nr:methyltransferase domain-containing protein [Gammaproteobacteria bacterium]
MTASKTLRYSQIILLATILSLIITNCRAEEKNVNPGINNYYYDAKFEKWLETFESPGREVYDKKEAILHEVQIKPGMRIADIGAGTGLYSIAFAQQTGEKGLVYAVDISHNFVKNIELRAKNQGLKNIKGIINNQKEIGLAQNSIDLAFICDTYHHFEYPLTTLQSVYQALSSGGKLIIIDFKRDPHISTSWVMGHVRANKEKVIKEVESIGFKLTDDKNILERNFFLSFIK